MRLPTEILNQRILYCILDWGLGHATRSVPLIKKLQQQNNFVTIASTENILKICNEACQNIEEVHLPAYDVNYYSSMPAWLSILWQYKKIKECIGEEHRILNELNKTKQWDLIISDSRYGCYVSDVPSILISHQLYLQAPFFSKWINKLYQKYLMPFNTIWVPDSESGASLSGDLSRHEHISNEIKAKRLFISYSPRFNNNPNFERPFEYCFILSGPEPLRSQLEEEIIERYRKAKVRIALIRGTAQNLKTTLDTSNIQVVDFANTQQLQAYIHQSKAIVCRSGYSSILDYYKLTMPKYIIATRGQTEQIYLAKYLNGKHGFRQLHSVSELPVN